MTANKTQRLQSLDVMRGLTVAMMILVNNQYGESFAPLQHAKWNGMTPCDLVFPFFLFIMGISTYLSLMKTGFKPTAGCFCLCPHGKPSASYQDYRGTACALRPYTYLRKRL